MMIPKRHSMLAHSRSLTSEEFALIIIRFRLPEYRANKAARKLCPFGPQHNVMAENRDACSFSEVSRFLPERMNV